LSFPNSIVIDERHGGGALTLRLRGELDLEGASCLRAHLERLQRSYRGRLVLDLGEVEFIQSAGIAVLLEADGYARRDGWMLEIRPGPAHVQRVLRFTGVLDHLPFTEC
jgi:anti-sigma B factor antagonist